MTFDEFSAGIKSALPQGYEVENVRLLNCSRTGRAFVTVIVERSGKSKYVGLVLSELDRDTVIEDTVFMLRREFKDLPPPPPR